MAVQHLDEVPAARLRSAAYTYGPVGQTASGPPPGFAWFERSATLARRDFAAVTEELFMWRLHERAGLRVWVSDAPLRANTVVLMRLGAGPASLRLPCRVVYVVDEPGLRGFAYGTLPGHPEAGEECFLLRHHDDGSIELTISAFSRPATRLARLGGALSRKAQQLMTGRYLRALDSSG
ncbi:MULTISPECIES: DUF1990 family protein [Nocardioides]|uniref:DUF1990 family protein n=1 Tax=Nocardioides vastitatis TaxID=2568655 RepID=A0ABW0ZCP2_9ACTN|nr:DUF1990 domain-containing protein [Nocardioides sp.]THI90842.1 DUF1990 domain-containing protein [Nocardioides sp.]